MNYKPGDKIRCKADWLTGPKKGDVLTIREVQKNGCTGMSVALFEEHRSWYTLDGRLFGQVLPGGSR